MLELCKIPISDPLGSLIWPSKGTSKKVYTVNMEIIYWGMKLRDYREVLERGITVIDGHWVYSLLKLKYGNVELKKNPGSRVIFKYLELAREERLTTLIVGPSKEVFTKVQRKFPEAPLHYYDPGKVPLDPRGQTNLIKELGELVLKLKPDLLVVALGPPKQEFLIDSLSNYLERAAVSVAIGVGGALKMVAGSEKLAPDVIYNLGLEWAWRLVQDPKRFRKVARSLVALACSIIDAITFRCSNSRR